MNMNEFSHTIHTDLAHMIQFENERKKQQQHNKFTMPQILCHFFSIFLILSFSGGGGDKQYLCVRLHVSIYKYHVCVWEVAHIWNINNNHTHNRKKFINLLL